MFIFIFICNQRSFVYSFAIMSSADIATVAPESVSVAVGVERAPTYWPLTLDEVRDCDLSYLNDKWSEDMIKDGMRAILIANALPELAVKEINVWKYLSEYSPPSGQGFQFSAGDDPIVTLVQNNMKTGHSGCSMGWTMRNIEFIAKNGVGAHRDMFLENKRAQARST